MFVLFVCSICCDDERDAPRRKEYSSRFFYVQTTAEREIQVRGGTSERRGGLKRHEILIGITVLRE
jgi:hypothetical protein